VSYKVRKKNKVQKTWIMLGFEGFSVVGGEESVETRSGEGVEAQISKEVPFAKNRQEQGENIRLGSASSHRLYEI